MTTVRPYRSEDKSAVLDVLERVWGSAIRRDHEFLWDWKHLLDPGPGGDPGREPQVVLRDGRVAGYNGALPMRVKIGDIAVDGAFCIDTFTDPGARGAGLPLLRRQLETAGVLIGAARPRAQALWTRLSGRPSIVLKQARKVACVLDPAPILAGRRGGRLLAGPARTANRLARRLLVRRAPEDAGAALEEIDHFPEEIDALGAAFAARFRNIVPRRRVDLEWRFVRCPMPYRRVLLRRGGRAEAYVVYRVALLNGRRVVLLVEIAAIGRAAENYRVLLAHVEREALQEGACEIETIDPGDPVLANEMRRRGYFRKKDRVPIIAFAAARIADDVFRPGRWYLGLGDADFEFVFFNQGVGSLTERRTASGRRAS